MEDKRHDLLLNVIEDFDPDILFLMETDQTWIDAVQPAHARYSTLLREPRPVTRECSSPRASTWTRPAFSA